MLRGFRDMRKQKEMPEQMTAREGEGTKAWSQTNISTLRRQDRELVGSIGGGDEYQVCGFEEFEGIKEPLSLLLQAEIAVTLPAMLLSHKSQIAYFAFAASARAALIPTSVSLPSISLPQPTSISIATTISLGMPEASGLPVNDGNLPLISVPDLPLPTSLLISLPPVSTSISLSLPLPLPTDTTISLELPLPTGVNP